MDATRRAELHNRPSLQLATISRIRDRYNVIGSSRMYSSSMTQGGRKSSGAPLIELNLKVIESLVYRIKDIRTVPEHPAHCTERQVCD